MTDEMKRDYTRRISQSSRTEIIVILYELAINYMQDEKDMLDAGNHEGARDESLSAQRVFGDLIGSLDFSYEIAMPLFRVYEYLNKQVSMAVIRNNSEMLVDAIRLTKSLKESFDKLASMDTSGPVMGNTEAVYSGLTYGKGSLNDSVVVGGDNRGYMA